MSFSLIFSIVVWWRSGSTSQWLETEKMLRLLVLPLRQNSCFVILSPHDLPLSPSEKEWNNYLSQRAAVRLLKQYLQGTFRVCDVRHNL